MSMLTVTCRLCGHDFIFPEALPLHECPACGTAHTRPKAQGASLDVLRRANHQRVACDFVNAERSYQHVLLDHPDEHEALWGLVLCRYGVEYVEDPRTGKRMPTVHFLRRKPMQEDADFLHACGLAPEEIRAQYQADAAYIDGVFAAIPSAPADPPDIFICYKATDPANGGQTEDLERARMLYYELNQLGYRPFFAHVSLQSAVGANYEAMIFHALQSAKVMLVVCSNSEWLSSPWVHSEWSRFLERVDQDSGCCLIPLLYDKLSPYALPPAFTRRKLEGLRMSDLGAFDSLRKVLSGLLGAPEAEDAVARALLRIEMALEDGDWAKAEQLTSELIDAHPACARAHLFQLLASLRLHSPEQLITLPQPFEDETAWQRAIRFSSADERDTLNRYLAESKAYRRNLAEEAARQEAERREAAEREAARQEAERREAAEREAARQEAERRKAAERKAKRQEVERRKAAEREAKRQEAERQEAERREAAEREAQQQAAPKPGELFITRRREWPMNGGALLLFIDGRQIGTLSNGQTFHYAEITKDCEISICNSSKLKLDSVHAEAGQITRVQMTWPLLGPIRLAVTRTPA